MGGDGWGTWVSLAAVSCYVVRVATDFAAVSGPVEEGWHKVIEDIMTPPISYAYDL